MRAVVRSMALAVGGALTILGGAALARVGVNFSDLQPSLAGLVQLVTGLTLVGFALVPTQVINR